MKYGGFFDVEKKEKELKDIEVEIESRPDFWTNPEVSAPVLKKKSLIENGLNRANKLAESKEDLAAALDLAAEGEEEYLSEAENLVTYLEEELEKTREQEPAEPPPTEGGGASDPGERR